MLVRLLFVLGACADPATPPDDSGDPTRSDTDEPTEPPPPAPEIILNEWMASNDSVLQLEDGSLPDWFELYNVGTEPVDLGTVRVADASGASWTGPAGVWLDPGGHQLVIADDAATAGGAPFKLDADDDRLDLWVDEIAADGVVVASFPKDVASARTPDGAAWASTTWASPGAANPTEASPTLDPSDVFFGDDELTTFAITVDAAYENALNVQFGEGVPGTVTFQGVTFEVEVKLKGGGSFQPLGEKPAWKIDVNEFVSGQRLRGLKAITLNNGDHDPTFVRESLAYEAFAAVGIPAMRVGWSRVTYNGEDYGLYINVETTDDLLLERWFADASGMLLEGSIEADLDTWDLFEVEENDLDPVFLAQLAAVIADPAAVDAMEEFEALVDVDAFVTYAAVEALTLHWDGYQRPKNYHVYLDPTTGRLLWIPHGTDWTWVIPNTVWNGLGAAFEFCLGQPDCYARYKTALISVSDTFDTLGSVATFESRYAWLEPEILTDPRNLDTPEFRAEHVAATAATLAGRTAEIREAVAAAP